MNQPLVSAIMPTRARPELAAEAVCQWRDQTYRPLELVIIDDADAPSFPHGITAEDIQYHRLPERRPIGAKRNIACSRAQGEIIAHWDDDDLYQPDRIANQVATLLASGSQVVAYRSCEFVHATGRRWLYGVGDSPIFCVGASLVYWRSWWQGHPFGENKQVGEDGDFRDVAINAKAITTTDGRAFMTARRHGANTANPTFGGGGWQEITA